MKGERKIERYIEAKRAVAMWEAAIADEGETTARHSKLLQARAEFKAARGALTGGEMAAAERRLHAVRWGKEETVAHPTAG